MREKRARTAHARKKRAYGRKGFTHGRRGGGAKNRDGNAIRCSHISTWEGEGCQLAKDTKLVCQSAGGHFFLFCQNLMDAKLIC
jgi:hypothetical protein